MTSAQQIAAENERAMWPHTREDLIASYAANLKLSHDLHMDINRPEMTKPPLSKHWRKQISRLGEVTARIGVIEGDLDRLGILEQVRRERDPRLTEKQAREAV